jgi:hypothetical protein
VNGNANGRIWSIIVLLCGVMLSVQGFVAVQVWTLASRTTAIESNRWTSRDAALLIEKLPPEWVRDRILHIQEIDKRQQIQLDRVEALCLLPIKR